MTDDSRQLPEDLKNWRIVRQETSGEMFLVSVRGGTNTAPISDAIPQAMIDQARRIQAFALAFDPVTNRRRQ